VEAMLVLNDRAALAARAAGAQAATDVTGFGLLGHLHGLARASGVAARVEAGAVPALPGVDALLAGEDALSGGTRRNQAYAEGFARVADDVPAWRQRLVCDAMTSGGLLVAVAPERAAEVPGAVIGELLAGERGRIEVV
jgi:selenide,water dikinase